MTVALDHPLAADRVAFGGLAVAGAASLGAGAVHAAAIGAHAEHRVAALVFAVTAAAQLGWGAVALGRATHALAAVGVALQGACLAGFVMAKRSGIPFVEGLDHAEPIQLADGAAAAFAVLAILATLGSVVRRFVPHQPFVVALVAVATVALALPATVSVADHVHAGSGHTRSEHTGGDHDHPPAGAQEPAAHEHAATTAKPYDPTKPIDLGGVEGVTPEQQAAAENLIAVTLLRLPKYASTEAAAADGFHSIGDGITGYEHWINWGYIDDGRILDPDYPESLVYKVTPTGLELQAAMYMLSRGTTLDDVPTEVGGKLVQWHVHDNLCFTPDPVAPKVRGLANAAGECAGGLVKGGEIPMVHVWIVKHRCGPFAALEGVAGGSIKPGEERLCDHAHGSH